MKTLTFVVVSTLLWNSIILARERHASNNDSLVPSHQSRRYEDILNSKMQKMPFNCGRVIIQPAFSGESSVSIFCSKAGDGQKTCQIIYAVAAANLYQATDAGRHPDKAKHVTMNRIDVEISPNTATMIREIWSWMLKAAHLHDMSTEKWARVPVDATVFEFSLENPDGSPLRAELDLFLPRQGGKTQKLVKLSETLINYCRADTRDRERLAKQISHQATDLLTMLR